MSKPINIFWFRRDLRLTDNTALFHALNSPIQTQCIFIFDTTILDRLEEKEDARVQFIHQSIQHLKDELQGLGKDLLVYHEKPIEVFEKLTQSISIKAVYVNRDYEPAGISRDKEIESLLQKQKISLYSFKDIVIFEQDEICKDDQKPYTIFTPYSKKWRLAYQKLNDDYFDSENRLDHLVATKEKSIMPTLSALGFEKSSISIPDSKVPNNIVSKYDQTRDFPAMMGTSRLGIHLRFGTISIRALAKIAAQLNDTFLNELIWRDFYHQIIFHFPYVQKTCFKPAYEAIKWRNNVAEFEAWCNGQTGYPMVDAGMRELNATGFIHNRARMVVASFLCKHLLIDWRWGELYFAQKLLDFDLAANNGGWQWAAGCGTDAAPYFRIFNPSEQAKRFDAQGIYIRQWVPEYDSLQYVQPIVVHTFARERCLKVYKEALSNQV